MPASISDLLAIWDRAEEFVSFLKDGGNKNDVLQVRKALRTFQFSKSSMDALSQLCDARTDVNRERLVGQIAIRQRDTRNAFRQAGDVLREFRFRDDLSVRGEQLVNEIIWGKTTVRKELRESLLAAAKADAKEDLEAILNRVRSLNAQIVELDDRLGGIILD